MYLMIAIFFMELIFSVLPKFIGEITNLIAKIVVQMSPEESSRREEIKQLKEEQSHFSMTDNFVPYTRLQRKIDKLMMEIKQMGGIRQQKATYLRMGVSVGLYVLHAILMILLLIYYRSEPLMHLPPEWVSPMSKIVAFPSGIHGAVGLGCWVMISNTVIRRGRNLVGI